MRFPRPSRTGVAALVAFVLAGFLMVTSARVSQGQDLRATSVTDLRTLVDNQKADTDEKIAEVSALNQQVDTLTKGTRTTETDRLQKRIDLLKAPAGLDDESGSGVTVVLNDAPQEAQDEALKNGTPPAERLVVHQQDIQAVVNALWLGGATAVSVMNQRVISTTGIKCAGPIVILHDVPYTPPYVIKAVGDQNALLAALDRDDYLQAYRADAAAYGLTYEVTPEAALTIPAYDGRTNLRYAKPLKLTS